MTRLILSALLVAAVLSGTAPAFAGAYGNAVREQAAAGQITPHGIWDSK